MTTATQKQKTLFPDLPHDMQIVDQVTGQLMPQWHLFFEQFLQALQTNFQKEGVRAPSQEATDITNIKDQENLIGNIIYDSTNKVFKGIILDTAGDPPTTQTKTFQFV